jgi:photosystem I P700 chlorophyll a apoprotein A1
VHASAHEFGTQERGEAQSLGLRQVFSSNIAHLSLVFAWMGGMIFHAAYLANFSWWWGQEKHCWAIAQQVYRVVGQDLINGEVGA